MAVRFDAAADRLLRTADLLDYNAVYTWMAWIYLVSDLNAAGRLWSLNTNSTTNDFDFVGVTTDGTTLIARTAVGAATTTGTGTNLSIQTWYHVALVRSATNVLDVYLNGVSDSTHTRNTAGRTAVTRMEVGAWTSGNANRTDSRICAMKAYTTNLSVAEIANEMNTYRPQRTDNLYAWWPIFTGDRTTDYNSNVRAWTEGGTLTDEDPPPVSYGASIYYIPFSLSEITGTASITEADDTLASAGTVDVSGTAGITEADDTLAAAGTVAVVGSAALTEAADTLSSAGAVDVVGTAALTEAADSVASAGMVAVVGTSAITEDDDSLSSAGVVPIAGSASLTEAADSVSAAGVVPIAGAASITEADDTLASDGTVTSSGVTGTAALTEAADSISTAGTVSGVSNIVFVDARYIIVADFRHTDITADPRVLTMALETRNTAIVSEARHRQITATPILTLVEAAARDTTIVADTRLTRITAEPRLTRIA